MSANGGWTSGWQKWLYPSWLVGFLWLVAAVVFGLLWAKSHSNAATFRDLFVASATMLVLVLFVTAFGGGFSKGQDGSTHYGLWSPIIGQDNRVSTSATQIALWTALLAFVIVYFSARTWLDGTPDLFSGFSLSAQSSGKDSTPIWNDYLVLLGGPFAAMILARGIVSAKVSSGVLQKTVADNGDTAYKQLLTNDEGNVDLVDTQYFVFNLVALVYVIIGLAAKDRLPTIPGLLMALTGSSAATYVVNKGLVDNQPVITRVIPARAKANGDLVVVGRNFMPDGQTQPTVLVGTAAAAVVTATDTKIAVKVPPGVAVGATEVTVTTSADVTSEQMSFEVIE